MSARGGGSPPRTTGRGRALGATLLAAPLLLAILAALVAGPARAPAQASCPTPSGDSVTFEFIDHDVQRAAVPAGVDRVTAEVRGGHGGYTSNTGKGGRPGLVEGSIPVSAGDCLEVYVGGYGGGSRWGFGFGGVRGEMWAQGHDGDGGAGASAVVVDGTAMIVAGGGGGGGGNGATEFHGGAGGDGAGGAGPGTPNGGNGGNGQGVPVIAPFSLGGIGGAEEGHGGAGGANGYTDVFAGAGGGGGAGWHGGGGGGAWQGTAPNTLTKPVGGGGGGGGDSYADPSVERAVFSVANVDCPEGGHGPECDGEVVLTWVQEPANVIPYMGGGQEATITTQFAAPLTAKVTAASGEPLSGTEVEFELPDSGPSGEFTTGGRTASATTDANGLANSPPIVANDVGGGWSATASVEGVSRAARFPLQNDPATTHMRLLGTTAAPVSGQQVRFVASVAAAPSSAGIPQGVVQFEVDGAPLGGAVQLGPTGLAESDPIALDVGKHQVAARYEGTPEFESASAELALPVERALAAVSLSSSENPVPAGELVTITAQIGAASPGSIGPDAPTGSVRFAIDGGEPGPPVPVDPSGAAATSLTLEAGHHLVTATYSGDSQLQAAASELIQVAGNEVTATEVTSSDPAAAYGEPLSLTALVRGPGPLAGAVTFSASSGAGEARVLCEDVEVEIVSLDGVAECEPADPLEPGEYSIRADYTPAQAGVSPSSGRMVQQIVRAPVEAMTVATPDPMVYGSDYELETVIATPVVADPDGSVRFAIDGSPVGQPVPLGPFGATLSGDALPGLAAGPHVVASTYEGSARFQPATSGAILVVDAAPTVTSLASSRQGAPARAPVRFTADVALDGGGTGQVEGEVQFWLDGEPFGPPVPVENGSATSQPTTGLARGEHDVRAWFSSPGNFGPSTAELIQRTGPPKPRIRQLPCPPARILLTDVHHAGGVTFVNGVADRRLPGRRVAIRRGSRTVAWTNVLADGTFWARITHGDRFSAAGAYSARVAGAKSRWRRSRAIRVVKRRPLGQRTEGKPRVRLRIDVAAKRLVLGRQLGCGPRSAKEIRRVRSPGKGGARTLALRRPKAGRPFAVYRVFAPNRRHYSPPIVIRARGSARSG